MSWRHLNHVPKHVEDTLACHDFFEKEVTSKGLGNYDRHALLQRGRDKFPELGEIIADYLLFFVEEELKSEANHTDFPGKS